LKIHLGNIGKKYNYNWIFRNQNWKFDAPTHVGILGNNGSGKSTFLKVLAGFLSPSEGEIRWVLNEKDVSSSIFRYTGIASPHLELIEEFSLKEIIAFQRKFRKFIGDHDAKSIITLSGLGKNADKPLKYFSSGMKQRVKLLLAVLSDNPLVILDEPCSNLDHQSTMWYRQLLEDNMGDRLLIIGSNDKETECFSCTSFIDLSAGK
jgi:ABC-type multidrug transport system ATPase subunit